MSIARLLQDWLEGWNTRDVDRIMRHYAEDATFTSPTVLLHRTDQDGVLRGKAAIRDSYRRRLEQFPNLRFELEDVIERPYGVVVLYRKLGLYVKNPGLTVEVFGLENGLVRDNVVYWGVEEVASQFRPRTAPP